MQLRRFRLLLPARGGVYIVRPEWAARARSTSCAVVILAVVERPGRSSSDGVVEGDDDLEVLGFFRAGGGLRSGDAGGAQQRLIADQGDVSLEDLAGNGVDA